MLILTEEVGHAGAACSSFGSANINSGTVRYHMQLHLAYM